MDRRDIEFNAEGVVLRGWFYPAEHSPAPAVVMAHGFSAVKEMYLVAGLGGEPAAAFGRHNLGAGLPDPFRQLIPPGEPGAFPWAFAVVPPAGPADRACPPRMP
jgi:hypothetical protein